MYLKVKRLIDVVLSLIGIILLSPIFLILILGIKIDSKCPIFFKQKRIGIHKSHFHILKFRTMKMDTPKDMPTHLLQDPDQYITRMGKFLRKTSLDELPQIWNIFVGQMSIIGPRPALWNQYDLIQERDKYSANDVIPGLTGWAQINGRDELPIEVKSKLDGEYVDRMSFRFDVKCFVGTVVSVVKHDGVVEGGTGSTAKKETASGKEQIQNEKNSYHRSQ
jgi:O-antigen biosynthesis protein WbqP